MEAEREVNLGVLVPEEGQGRSLFVEECGPKAGGRRKW
jgi:hypothetical protein